MKSPPTPPPAIVADVRGTAQHEDGRDKPEAVRGIECPANRVVAGPRCEVLSARKSSETEDARQRRTHNRYADPHTDPCGNILATRIIDENARAPMPAKTPRAAAAARSLKVMGGVPATVSSAAVP